jgi:radical SAM protein with 4Fe4S-binding SPASM domain
MNLKDALNFSSKITFKRIINAFKIYSSYLISKNTGIYFQKGLPFSISVEPTTSCNLRCPECPSGLRSFTRATGMLSLDLFKNIIDQTHEHLLYLILYFQGEPYLNKDFFQMVKYAVSKKIYTSTSTNAHYLSDENARKTIESGLDRLIISIDGTTQSTYEAYRKGGNLEKVLEGTENIIKWKKVLKSSTPHIVFQFLVVKANENQTREVQELATFLGVDEVVFKTAQIYNYKNGSDLIPDNQKYSRYKKKTDGTWVIKNKLENSCWKMWHSTVFTWNGSVLPCCFDKDGKYQLGSISKTQFREIWSSVKYNSFRKSILKSRKDIDICKNCTEGTKVWAV